MSLDWQQAARVHETSRKKVGAAIAGRRKELGYSQERFAQFARIDRGRYGRIERGEVNLTLESLFILAANLDIKPSLLLKDISVDDCMGKVPEADGE